MGFLANKRILITGMISNRSIAYGVAQAMHREGAELAFTYQGERIRDRVSELAQEFGSELLFPCDVASDGQGGVTEAGRPQRRATDPELSRRSAHHAALQCDGHGQGQPRSQRALSGNEPRQQ